MHGIDETLKFKSINIAILTVSDTRTAETDTSGDLLQDRVEASGHKCVDRHIIKDERSKIAAQVEAWAANAEIDAVITTGGTGLTKRDVTPEAVRPLFDKELEGFSVIYHQESYKSVGVSTLQSRALAGLSNGTLIFCLPGSNGAVKDGWDKVIKLELDCRHKPCNLVELMPRMKEA